MDYVTDDEGITPWPQSINLSLSDSHELEKINQSDSMSFCELLPSEDIISETSKFESLAQDLDTDIPIVLNSKYYSVEALPKLKKQTFFTPM